MNWFGSIFNSLRNATGSAFLPFRFWSTSPQFNDYTKDSEKINAVFSNPALLKVITLQCDLFSLAEVYVYKDGKIVEGDPALDRLNAPNPLQSRKQWLWDYMFWTMVGNANLYIDSNIVTKDNNRLYFLENNKIEWPLSLEKAKDKMLFSAAAENELMSTVITYRYADGTTFKFPLKKLKVITDLSNGIGNWFKGFSRIDALYKVITNSEASLDAKNINTRYSGKFMVAGKSDPTNVSQLPLGEAEKQDIETKINGPKDVHAVKSMIDIKRFVEDIGRLKLDEGYLASYFLIGNMYNIPRDVLEAYASSTYENQGKATAKHVSYTLEPKGEDLTSAIGRHWGYDKEGKKIVMSWDHLPFNQIFEKERAVTDQLKAQTFINLRKSGVSLDDANEFLDTNFKEGGDNGTVKATA